MQLCPMCTLRIIGLSLSPVITGVSRSVHVSLLWSFFEWVHEHELISDDGTQSQFPRHVTNAIYQSNACMKCVKILML